MKILTGLGLLAFGGQGEPPMPAGQEEIPPLVEVC